MQAAFSKESATLVAGAAIAAALGVLLGGAMQPQLIFDRELQGPQMSAAGGGARSSDSFDQGGSYAAYAARVPSYVVGTDHAQAAYAGAEPEVPPIAEDVALGAEMADREAEAPPPPAPLARAHYDEPPLPEVAYPSVDGGRSYGAGTPEPPPPPEEDPLAVSG